MELPDDEAQGLVDAGIAIPVTNFRDAETTTLSGFYEARAESAYNVVGPEPQPPPYVAAQARHEIPEAIRQEESLRLGEDVQPPELLPDQPPSPEGPPAEHPKVAPKPSEQAARPGVSPSDPVGSEEYPPAEQLAEEAREGLADPAVDEEGVRRGDPADQERLNQQRAGVTAEEQEQAYDRLERDRIAGDQSEALLTEEPENEEARAVEDPARESAGQRVAETPGQPVMEPPDMPQRPDEPAGSGGRQGGRQAESQQQGDRQEGGEREQLEGERRSTRSTGKGELRGGESRRGDKRSGR